jgi:hypothetical protein
VDIELGCMKYYYFKYGIVQALKRVRTFNRTLGQSINLDPKDFYIHTLLTDTEEIDKQLDKELLQYV